MEQLNKIPKKNPFKVPDNYFEELNERILSNTTNSDSAYKKRSASGRFYPLLRIAAILCGLVLISYFTIKFMNSGTDKNSLSGITLNEFTEIYFMEIDENALEENFIEHEPTLSNDVNKSDIINYLQNEDLNLSDIYELL